MRRMIWLGLVVTLLWCAWWMAASLGMERAIANWLDAQRAEGWKVEVQETTRAGFPFTLHTRITGIAILDPQNGIGFSADHLDLKAAAYWPGHVQVALPQTPIQLFSPDGNLTLKMTQAEAKLRLHPGTALELQSMTWDAGAWTLGGVGGDLLSAQTWHMSMHQSEDQAERYKVSLSSQDLIPGEIIRTVLELPPSWPEAFDMFSAELNIRFDRPWDRAALSKRRPQPRALSLPKALVTWGTLNASLGAELVIDEEGTPSGTASFKAEGWRQLLNTGKGAMVQPIDPQTQAILNLLSGPSDAPDTIDLEITFEDGKMRMGFIPLGGAPKIILH